MKKNIMIMANDFGCDSEDEMGIFPIMAECDPNEDFLGGVDSLGEEVPILPLRNMVLFPGAVLPVVVGRDSSLSLLRDAKEENRLVGVVCQLKARIDNPKQKDLYSVGVIAEVVRIFELPDGSTTAILQGKQRFVLRTITQEVPYLKGRIELKNDLLPDPTDQEFGVLISMIKDLTIKMLKTAAIPISDLVQTIRKNQNPLYVIGFACSNLRGGASEKMRLLQIDDIKQRTFELSLILNRECQLIELRNSIQMKTQAGIDKQQREFFLQQQMRTIQNELGCNANDLEIEELKQKAKQKQWSAEVGQFFDKELQKLQRINPQSPDYATQVQYMQTILSLPWNEYTSDNFNLKRAERILDRDHFGLEKVKERILEHLAVLKLKGDMKSPILCLYGPPGVGKTSLGHSIADALGRHYLRISLGGLHDEAEIRGHRRTYIGAMPGRIIHGLQKTASSNPVFILDEIDKVGNDFRGDPSSALLEVLDPEQNATFHDNYLDIDYDLSKVMFIATANNLNTISQPLLDRMELIEVSGYILEEKVEIAIRHLIPKQFDAHGLEKGVVKIPRRTVQAIIESYTRESGVRELEKKIAKLMRRLVRHIASGEELPAQISPADLKEYLGPIEYTRDKYQGNDYAGVVTGLAWTAVGGEILFVETSLSKGKGLKLTVTGNLGDVMKESAALALEYIHAHATQLGIDEQMFENWNVHVHVPEGAIPKDGPSAGVTMMTSMVSAFTQRKVRPNLAMTGEITLRGRVLPVGGIREKILAAKRAGIKEILLCEDNRRNIEEINPDYLKGLTFYFVRDMQEVIQYALLPEKVSNPLF